MELSEKFKEIIDNIGDYVMVKDVDSYRFLLYYKPTFGIVLIEVSGQEYEDLGYLLIEKGIEQSDTAPKPDANYKRKSYKWDPEKNMFVEYYD
jgi:hypothetical protein